MATYKKSSPWFKTKQNFNYLDILEYRFIPKTDKDYPYEIENKFRHRPDLLAHALYGNSELWWIFAQRNPSLLKDPVFDFEPGLIIYIPTASTLQNTLGV